MSEGVSEGVSGVLALTFGEIHRKHMVPQLWWFVVSHVYVSLHVSKRTEVQNRQDQTGSQTHTHTHTQTCPFGFPLLPPHTC